MEKDGKHAKSLLRGARVAAVMAASLLAGAAHAAAPQLAAPKPAEAAKFREVTDEIGRHVRLPLVVRRVVSLAPSLTETVYALGLQELLVGDTDFCDYPENAKTKPKVGGAINPNLERIAALRPDLVLVTKGLNRLETVNALEQMGIATYATNPQTVEEIVASSRRLAEALGAPEVGATLAGALEQRLAELKQRLAGVPPKRVLFLVWTEPLISTGQHTFLADALRHAGAESIVDSKQDWPQVSLEEVVHLQPEYLVCAASHSDDVTCNFGVLATRPGWSALQAMTNRKFVVVSDAINRTSPRIVSAVEDLARQLHPEAFVTKPETGKPDQAAPPASGKLPRTKVAASDASEKVEAFACAR